MIVLDTNVVSELMRPTPDPDVVAWVDNWPTMELAVTSVTVAEVLYGIGRLDDGQRKATLQALAHAMFEEDFHGRVLPFGFEEAEIYAGLVVQRERDGLPISMADAQIAAVTARHRARLATRNTRDFAGLPVDVVNPWEKAD